MTTHYLTWLLAVPAISALVVLLLPRSWEGTIKRFSIGSMLVELIISIRLILADYSDAGYHFIEHATWVESFGISYKVGVDGLSLWLVILTTLLSPIALYASWGSITTRIKEYAFSFLLLELGMLGAFVALDLFLFYVFWELMLVPMYLIIGIWGGKDRVYAAVKFFLYTMVGSLLMLVAILYVVASYEKLAGHYTFDLQELSSLVLPALPQYLLFAAFALAFAIKVPMFPFHTWLPDAHVQAPTGGSVILAAVLLKLGIYGFIRFAMPLFPVASQTIGPVLAGRPRHRGHHLRRLRSLGAARPQEARRVQLGEPHGLHPAWAFRHEPPRYFGRHPADDQPRHLDWRALPSGGSHLRPPALPHARRLRRAREGNALVYPRVRRHHDELDRAAGHERLRWRVHDLGRLVLLAHPDRLWHVLVHHDASRRYRGHLCGGVHAARRASHVLGQGGAPGKRVAHRSQSS
jgi:hypothetical protein